MNKKYNRFLDIHKCYVTIVKEVMDMLGYTPDIFDISPCEDLSSNGKPYALYYRINTLAGRTSIGISNFSVDSWKFLTSGMRSLASIYIDNMFITFLNAEVASELLKSGNKSKHRYFKSLEVVRKNGSKFTSEIVRAFMELKPIFPLDKQELITEDNIVKIITNNLG